MADEIKDLIEKSKSSEQMALVLANSREAVVAQEDGSKRIYEGTVEVVDSVNEIRERLNHTKTGIIDAMYDIVEAVNLLPEKLNFPIAERENTLPSVEFFKKVTDNQEVAGDLLMEIGARIENMEGYLAQMAGFAKFQNELSEREQDTKPPVELPPEPEEKKDDKKGILDMLGGLFSLKALKGLSIGKMLKGSIMGIFKGIIKGRGKIISALLTGTTKLLSKVFSKFGMDGISKLLGKGLKFIPGLGQIISIGMAIYDAVSGFLNPEEIVGKSTDALTMIDRIIAGISKAVSGLTFGLLDPKFIFEKLSGIFEFLRTKFGELWEDVKSIASELGITSTLKKIYDFFGSTFEKVYESTTSFFNDAWTNIQNNLTGALDLITGSGDEIIAGVTNFGMQLRDGAMSIFEKLVTYITELKDSIFDGIKDKAKDIPLIGSLFSDDDDVSAETKEKPREVSPIETRSISRKVQSEAVELAKQRERDKVQVKQAQPQPVIVSSTTSNGGSGPKSTTITDMEMQLQMMGI